MAFDIEIPWDAENVLYLAAGSVVIQWGILDSAVTQCCDALIDLGGHHSHKQPPKALNRRLDLIRLCFRDDERLRGGRKLCGKVLRNTAVLTPRRDAIIHGALTRFNAKRNIFEFAKLNQVAAGYEIEFLRFSVKRLLKISKDAIELGADWLRLLKYLHGILDAQKGKKQPRRHRD